MGAKLYPNRLFISSIFINLLPLSKETINFYMQELLQELYKLDLSSQNYSPRTLTLESKHSYEIVGITQSGKTKVIKKHLLEHKKSSYLYIDCSDLRLNIADLNEALNNFCTKHHINIVALDNYNPEILLPKVECIIIASEYKHHFSSLTSVRLFALTYEEFLAHEERYDSSAIRNFALLGGMPRVHSIASDERVSYMQKSLRLALDDVGLAILSLCAKLHTQKVSAFMIYERLKATHKISKDRLYKSYEDLLLRGYIYAQEKLNSPSATKRLFLADPFFKQALSVEKNFGRLFENIIFLELIKRGYVSYYDDGIDFYIPSRGEVVLSAPFADESALFKKIAQIEAFLALHQVAKVSIITMSSEADLKHPISQIALVPFDEWALGEL